MKNLTTSRFIALAVLLTLTGSLALAAATPQTALAAKPHTYLKIKLEPIIVASLNANVREDSASGHLSIDVSDDPSTEFKGPLISAEINVVGTEGCNAYPEIAGLFKDTADGQTASFNIRVVPDATATCEENGEWVRYSGSATFSIVIQKGGTTFEQDGVVDGQDFLVWRKE